MSHIAKMVWSFDVKFCTLPCQTQECLRTKFFVPKFRNKKVIKWPNFELWSRFSQNLWTLVEIFRPRCKALGKEYKTPKCCGPKYKNIPIFSKLVNFGPHNLMFSESPREGLQATKIWWA